MKLFEVTNGYVGESYTRCLVIAGDPARAIELARPMFRAEAGTPPRYPDAYWLDLAAAELAPDTQAEWAGEVGS